jgi:hypothetical protein
MNEGSAMRQSLIVLEHHGKPLAPLFKDLCAMALAYGFQIYSERGGPNSWSLIHPKGHAFPIRGRRGPWRLEVKEKGKTINLMTRSQVMRWIKKIA